MKRSLITLVVLSIVSNLSFAGVKVQVNGGTTTNTNTLNLTGVGTTKSVSGTNTTVDLSNLQTNQGNTNASNITALQNTINSPTIGNSALENQIKNISLTPGPQGLQGIQGNTGLVGTVQANNGTNGATANFSTLNVSGTGVAVSGSGSTANLNLNGLQTNQSVQNASNISTLNTNLTNEANRAEGAEGILQNNINSETSARTASDAALQSQVSNINAQAQDNTNRIDRLEQTKYLLEPAIRLYDSKRWQVQAFDSYDVRQGMNFAAGARVIFKLGKSYEEKLIEKTNPEIAKLLAVNVSNDVAERDAFRKQLVEDRTLITAQAALLKTLQAQLDGKIALQVDLPVKDTSKILPVNEDGVLLQALNDKN